MKLAIIFFDQTRLINSILKFNNRKITLINVLGHGPINTGDLPMNNRLCCFLFLLFFSSVCLSDETLPVQVFVLAGQSNMVGHGIVSPDQNQLEKNEGMGTLTYVVENEPTSSRFQHLLSSEGNWRIRDDVWLANLNDVGKLSIKSNKIGPELQFGHRVGDAINAPVLLIKIAWGGKSLQTDFRPPSSGGSTGLYYTMMINKVHDVLNKIEDYYPNYQGQGVELAGFAWHQGWNDRVNQSANDEYQSNCVNLINDIRAEFKTGDLPFIIATTGMAGWEESHPRALSLMNAQLAVPNDPRLDNPSNVKAIDTRDFYREASISPTQQGYHWNSNAETYLLIGDGMASAMLDTLCRRNEDQGAGCVSDCYEAEENTNLYQSGVSQWHPGYTGEGFVDFGWEGSFLEWPSLYIANEGAYRITFRYANGSWPRTSRLIIDNAFVKELPFAATGSWLNWDTESHDVILKQGIQSLKIEATRGGPNLDNMLIESDLCPNDPNKIRPGVCGCGIPESACSGDVRIEAVYLAQNHVLETSSALLELVSDEEALIKVQVLASEPIQIAPKVIAKLTLDGQNLPLVMQGPQQLPMQFNSEPGAVLHSYDDSFTARIPKAWVKPGLSISITAGNVDKDLGVLNVVSPNKLKLNMFDVHYFQHSAGDYPSGWEKELKSKLPISDLELRRVKDLVFRELVIPPRAGVKAAKVISKEDYKNQTGLNFDGEQAAALQWVSALQAAAGRSRRDSLYYVNIHGVPAGGQAGGFKGVGYGRSAGVFLHELGHALSLPHWANASAYPYKGDMFGIDAPNSASQTHAGPTWAFDLPSGDFIPPTVQENAVGGELGVYKADPMQGGGQGDQEQGYLFRHFSDYSVAQMRRYLRNHLVIWNDELGEYAAWDTDQKSYSKVMENNGVAYAVNRDVEVYSLMVAVSAANTSVNMVYPPIGPYTAGTIDTFDPRSGTDRARALMTYCPSSGCDVTLQIMQDGMEKFYLLPVAWEKSQNPLSGNSLVTSAINLPAIDGKISQVKLLLTEDAERVGMPDFPIVLASWYAKPD